MPSPEVDPAALTKAPAGGPIAGPAGPMTTTAASAPAAPVPAAGAGRAVRATPCAAPLRIAPRRLRLWATTLAILGLVPVVGAPGAGWSDWPAFWSGGAMAGSAAILTPASQFAWRAARGELAAFFPYPPGAAWLFGPAASLPLPASFALYGLLVLAAAAGAGFIAARVYRLDRTVALLAVLAWAPVMSSIVIGQNGPLALLLTLAAIAALVEGRDGLAGACAGLLLYKPTFAAPLLLLLLVRGHRRALVAVVAVALGWYLASTAATGGDWAWPAAWLGGIAGYQGIDFAGNADKAVSLPGLLLRLGLPWPVIAGLAGCVLLASLPILRRRPILEAASYASLLGVALSPHAWGYDAALVLPAMLWFLADRRQDDQPAEGRPRPPGVVGSRARLSSAVQERFLVPLLAPRGAGLDEPLRTRLIVAAYLLVQLWLFSRQTVVSAVAVVVLGATAIWLAVAWGLGPAPARPGSLPTAFGRTAQPAERGVAGSR